MLFDKIHLKCVAQFQILQMYGYSIILDWLSILPSHKGIIPAGEWRENRKKEEAYESSLALHSSDSSWQGLQITLEMAIYARLCYTTS
jgi:hypothetical protein